MKSEEWKLSLERFFYERATAINDKPTLFDHCIVSAKDPRVSARPEVYEDVINSIQNALNANSNTHVLEVGCASGYIAYGLASRVGQYTGVDIANMPLEVARKMNLENADFIRSDGASLQFDNEKFDAVFAYDVFTNFPTFEDGVPIIREMLRVVKPGGRVLIGSLTNKTMADGFEARAREVSEKLEMEYGPLHIPTIHELSLAKRILFKFKRKSPPKAKPAIVVYYYYPDDFFNFARQENVDITMEDVHKLNPYFGYRFNIILTKPK